MSECQQTREAALDTLISGTDMPAAARQHASGCAQCRAELEQLSILWRDLGRLPVRPVTVPDAQTVWQLATTTKWNARIPMRRTQLIAALIGCLLLGAVGGYALQRGTTAQPASSGSTFLLLLHESATSDSKYTPEQMRSIVGEYRDWAQRLDAEKRLVSAEKLGTDSRWLAPDGSQLAIDQAEIVSGFFLLRARDYDEALQLARSSPHLKYGGTIEVRAIESTSTP
jgi:hypothetical protein